MQQSLPVQRHYWETLRDTKSVAAIPGDVWAVQENHSWRWTSVSSRKCSCLKEMCRIGKPPLGPRNFTPGGGRKSPVTPAVVPDRCPLARWLSNVQQGQPSDVKKTMTSAIKAEMQLFANTGNRRRVACRRPTAIWHQYRQCPSSLSAPSRLLVSCALSLAIRSRV